MALFDDVIVLSHQHIMYIHFKHPSWCGGSALVFGRWTHFWTRILCTRTIWKYMEIKALRGGGGGLWKRSHVNMCCGKYVIHSDYYSVSRVLLSVLITEVCGRGGVWEGGGDWHGVKRWLWVLIFNGLLAMTWFIETKCRLI